MANIRRNDPCHCGGGKKYERCHLDKDEAAERSLLPKCSLKCVRC